MSDLASQLAKNLRSLVQIQVLSKEDLTAWIDKADLIREKFHGSYKLLYPSLPEELEHYFQDPDIRLKDPAYGKWQTDFVLSLIANLESGNIEETA